MLALRTDVEPGDTPDLSYLSSVYFGIHLAGGHIGLPILVLLFLFSKRVRRPATVINFCATWIIYSVSYSLLVYGGHHHTRQPPFKLCLVQAAMIHGAPTMAAVAGLEVALQAWTMFMLPCQQFGPAFLTRLPKQTLIALIVSPPYIVFLVFALVTAYIAIQHPEDVSTTNALHCTITADRIAFQRFAVPLFCAVIVTAMIILEVAMITKYLRSWRVVRNVFPLATNIRRPSLSPWIRVTIFTVYSMAALGTCFAYLSAYTGPVPYMIQASMPLVATLIFGTQSDIMNVCLCVFHKFRSGKKHDCEAVEYTLGGGWSGSMSTEMSLQLTGHLSLVEGGQAIHWTATHEAQKPPAA